MLRKTIYQFDQDTLTYKKVDVNIIEHYVWPLFRRIALSLLIGIVFFVLALQLIDIPKNQLTEQDRRHLLLRYHILKKNISEATACLNDIQQRDDHVYRTVFEAQPIPESVREAGFGGADRYAAYQNSLYAKDLAQTAQQLDKLTKQIYIQSKSFDEIVNLLAEKEKMLASIPAVIPVLKTKISAIGPYGAERNHPVLGHVYHPGVDFCAPLNTPIYATGDGVVTTTKYNFSLGYYIIINHGYGYKTWYGHLNKMLVKPGQHVKRGDVIALMGSTGISPISHLHYEVHKNGHRVDPANYYYNDLSPEAYEAMVAKAEKRQMNFY